MRLGSAEIANIGEILTVSGIRDVFRHIISYCTGIKSSMLDTFTFVAEGFSGTAAA